MGHTEGNGSAYRTEFIFLLPAISLLLFYPLLRQYVLLLKEREGEFHLRVDISFLSGIFSFNFVIRIREMGNASYHDFSKKVVHCRTRKENGENGEHLQDIIFQTIRPKCLIANE